MKKENPLVIILAFFAVYIVWGTTYVAIIFGLKGFPPFTLSAIRFFTAGFLLFSWCILKGQKIPGGNTWLACGISGCLMLIGGSGFIAWSEKYVGPGYAAIISATTPFLFIFLDKKRWNEYFSNKLIIIGLIMGFAGLVLFFKAGENHTQSIESRNMFMIATMVLFISCILWVTGSLYSKAKLVNGHSNFMTASIQLMAAGAGSGLIAPCINEWKHFSFSGIPAAAWGSLIYLITMGSLVAFVAFTWLITVRPPAIVSMHTYINPVVAVILGWLITHEKLSLWQIIALFIILGGMLLTNLPNYRTNMNKIKLRIQQSFRN